MNYRVYAFLILFISFIFASFIFLKAYLNHQKIIKYKEIVKEHGNQRLSSPSIYAVPQRNVIGRLVIPKIGLDCLIKETSVNDYNTVYHYPESAGLGENGECALLGHRTLFSGPFKRIGELSPGDEVIVYDYTRSRKYIYVVVSNGEDIRWDYKNNPIRFEHGGEPRLLLITCYPPGRKDAAWITHCILIKSY
ncbi:peptidase C60 sortase A and B [Methanothermus fervidus DSM 2088]|uniref:Peptidase C60 sortase A and B n=1 Tax=Methanothermus fervidus (strain ATCC 43054 / DSM 2088 / JCM 10308 / V24 S) TaxID=523846 RepID=E3GZ13_METFV|nr:sortase [Methanothermus fervidus]ADP77545.1 peptidase C60 sortase A and B [Methanothermus fervidus DSM 2088]